MGGRFDRNTQKKPISRFQRKRLNELGIPISKTMSYAQAKLAIEKAELAIWETKKRTPASEEQRVEARNLGQTLPEGASYADAEELLMQIRSDAEMDKDPEDGAPATRAQLLKVAKLGGDAARAINRWRADAYIEELENETEQRIEDALDWHFGDREMRARRAVKKPSKAIMVQALKYGDAQGWGKGWELNHDEMFAMIEAAISAVAPQLLKEGWAPPEPIFVESQLAQGLVQGQGTERTSPAQQATTKPEAPPPDTIPCPHCFLPLPIDTLKEGANNCTWCAKSFNVRFD